ncbi:MAG: hypothetical protein AB7O65_01240 [Candidatus Korobacteraceae bacterium]
MQATTTEFQIKPSLSSQQPEWIEAAAQQLITEIGPALGPEHQDRLRQGLI